ncbi:hypothetical protein AX774_g7172 [Zancudomyces culisetae]|uniref:CCHC-type domain-containing protein n=1 Tax=Zancudomyces culisetae TaxID=1213189 RepID=A0A1R1PEI5_ZANCU|nr:hypothetical protein AX774_g7172 [Zancudomyces culisetae]|eukprot:OMH79415.1 hypothetical protein AX774_g7172 [Zancudomyces culisetae]
MWRSDNVYTYNQKRDKRVSEGRQEPRIQTHPGKVLASHRTKPRPKADTNPPQAKPTNHNSNEANMTFKYTTPTCYTCNEVGHISPQCPLKARPTI